MVIIQLRSEKDLAELIDLVKRNRSKISNMLYDASARWENMYFGEDPEEEVIRVIEHAPAPPRVEAVKTEM